LPSPIAATPVAPNTPHRATVTYAAGLLNVRADNSSLNQILRAIARLTGMTITGGVTDERVFGNYGPAEPSTILATLLDGTGSNMLLREGPNNTLAELVLTPRAGGATPPNPNAPGFDDGPEEPRDNGRRESPEARGNNAHSDDAPPQAHIPPGRDQGRFGQREQQQQSSSSDQAQAAQQQAQAAQQQTQAAQQQQTPSALPVSSGPVSIPLPANNVNGSSANTSPTASTYPTTNSVPIDAVPTPSTTPPSSGIVDAPNPPPADSTTGTNSGSSTPQSIYEQLRALQQQKQQQQSTPTTPQSQPATSTPPQ
jgi:hypothetical protein